MKRALWKIYGGVSTGVAIFVLGAGSFFSRRLTGSLRQLAKAADQISRGKLGKKVSEPANNDEILYCSHCNSLIGKVNQKFSILL